MTIRSFATAILIAAIASSIPYLAHAKADIKTSPPQVGVPQHIVELLKTGDLEKSILAMREEPSNSKISHLIRCANQIVLFGMQKKPSPSSAHEVYQNVAISYHNLFLFLKSEGFLKQEFFKQADNYYKKAKKAGSYLHKDECDVLRAALIAANGDEKKAEKIFAKIDDLMLKGDYESMEYLATYYAAMSDVDNAVGALEAAHRLNPYRMLAWIKVGDDFHNISTDPRYIAMIESWKNRGKKAAPTLTVPKRNDPHLNMIGNADPNAPLGMTKKAKRQHSANQNRKK